MQKQNPRQRALAGVEIVHCGGRFDPTRNRPVIQANETMRQRLAALLWGFPWTWESRHG